MSFFLFTWAKDLAHVVAGLFASAEKTYNKLTPEQQLALQNGSGLMDVINSSLEKVPSEVRALIQQTFPNLDEAAIEKAVFTLASEFNITKIQSLDEAIVAIQTYLNSKSGNAWEIASHLGASVLALLFAPAGTKVPIVVSIIEFVYQKFIKKQ